MVAKQLVLRQMGSGTVSYQCICLTTIFMGQRHAHPHDMSSRTPRGFAADGPAPLQMGASQRT
jgi:hypothetical protein